MTPMTHEFRVRVRVVRWDEPVVNRTVPVRAVNAVAARESAVAAMRDEFPFARRVLAIDRRRAAREFIH